MSDSQTGRPDFVAPVVTPLAAEPNVTLSSAPVDAAPVDAPRRPSRRGVVTTVLVVVALVVAGLTGGFVGRQILNPSPTCKPINGAKYTAEDGSFPSLPVALLDGQATPTRVEVVGVWCDVALIDLEYQQTENLNGDHSYTYFNTDVLRAVDVSTGKTLWTLDKSPDGSPLMFNSAVSENGKLALATMRDGGFTQPNDAELCINGTDMRVLNLRTGRVLTSTFVDGQCTLDSVAGDTMSTTASVVAYQDGVVVVEQNAGNVPMLMTGGVVSTAGYQDTDLETPLWAVGANRSRIISDQLTDRVLPGGWVRTGQGMYVPIATGDSSHIFVDGWVHRFFAAGDLALQADMPGTEANGFSTIAGWSDLTAAEPDWTYSPPDGWMIAQDDYLLNDFPFPKSVTPVVAVTSEAVIVMAQRWDDSGAAEANLTAISRADGTVLWAAPYEFASSDLATVHSMSANRDGTTTEGTFSLLARAKATVIDSNGTELLVYNEPGRVVLADARTGNAIASQTISARTASGMYQCGDASVCVAVDFAASPGFPAKTGMMQMSVSASSIGAPTETDLMLATSGYATTNVGYDGLYPTNAGLFGVVRQDSDYLFVLM